MTSPMPVVECRLRAVTGAVLAAGLRLAGVGVDEAASAREAADAIERLAARSETGVILVQQDYYDALPDSRRRAIERAPIPILVPIPVATWAPGKRAEDYILDLLHRAIGYRVRIQ